ncbi:MAG: carboxypeptidase regulatory-like domain-containing protein [Armatimonadetes bacterium]|nr:carboxypeptidase regulatory-like domain-containing protein [Armatimonadota bacterium]
MRTAWIFVALIAALFSPAVLGWPIAAAAQSRGAIRGQILDGTAGNRPLAGAEVRLWRMPAGQAGQLATVRTDSRGAFVFAALPADGTYLVVADYRGVTYTSQPVRLSSGRTTTVTVAVYEPTMDRPAIFFPYRLVVVERIGVGAIAIREILEVVNPSRYTYLGRDEAGYRVTFRVSAPRGARDLTALRGMAAPVISGGRLIDTAPLPPGSFQFAFGYVVRYWGTGAVLRWTLDERTEGMGLFVPDTGVRLRSAIFEPRSPGTIRGQRFLHYAGNDLGRGQVVEVRFSGLPAHFGPLAYWLAAFVALMLVTSLAVSVRRAAFRRSLESLPGGDVDPKPEPLG